MENRFQNHASDRRRTERVSCRIVKATGDITEQERDVVCECEMEISVNGSPVARLRCTPTHLTELVLGRLYTEGIIRGTDSVAHLFICGEGNIAEVTLTEDCAFQPYTGAEPTCCTGNRQLLQRREDVAELTNPNEGTQQTEYSQQVPPQQGTETAQQVPPQQGTETAQQAPPQQGTEAAQQAPPQQGTEAAQHPLPSPEAVFALAEHFRKDGELHRSTAGTHSCYIRFGDGSIRGFEDIGRHNALDKAVGAMLLAEADPEACMLYTTGRVPVDMVQKTLHAGIPVLISKAVPTDAAVRMAAEHGLTLICRAWPDSYECYTV